MTLPPPVHLTVDLVVLTIRDESLHVLLVERGIEPFRGRLALPGGFVEEGEDLGAAAERELAEETGLSGLGVHLEQLATFGDPGRDPRGRVVTVAYLALAPTLGTPTGGSDAAGAGWYAVPSLDLGALAFDHARVVAAGLDRARAKLEYTTLATTFCAGAFTIAELRQVYEAVWGVALDPRNFHRKVTGADGFVIPTKESTTRNGGRPATLYRAGAARVLHPPMLRPQPGSDS